MSHKMVDNNLVTIHKGKLALKLNKHVYIRMRILELSKVLMYKFHYARIKNKYDNNTNLLFTDTYKLMYEIKTEDFYDDFSSEKGMFDFSNYWNKSKYYDNSNKIVIVKMKDKTGDVANKEFVLD